MTGDHIEAGDKVTDGCGRICTAVGFADDGSGGKFVRFVRGLKGDEGRLITEGEWIRWRVTRPADDDRSGRTNQ